MKTIILLLLLPLTGLAQTEGQPVQVTKTKQVSKTVRFLAAAAVTSATMLDAYSTRTVVRNDGYEKNPFVRPFSHSSAIYPVMALSVVPLDVALLRSHKSKKYIVVAAVATGLHLYLAERNFGLRKEGR